MTTLDEAHGRLMARLEDLEHVGEEIPCRGPAANDWISETRDRQEFAADQCHGCPALEQCADYALTFTEPAGVWGGLTVARRTSLRRTQTTNRKAAA